jgi:hypothetical protein
MCAPYILRPQMPQRSNPCNSHLPCRSPRLVRSSSLSSAACRCSTVMIGSHAALTISPWSSSKGARLRVFEPLTCCGYSRIPAVLHPNNTRHVGAHFHSVPPVDVLMPSRSHLRLMLVSDAPAMIASTASRMSCASVGWCVIASSMKPNGRFHCLAGSPRSALARLARRTRSEIRCASAASIDAMNLAVMSPSAVLKSGSPDTHVLNVIPCSRCNATRSSNSRGRLVSRENE